MMRCCLIVLCGTVWLTAARAEAPAENKATVAFVRGLQTESGGFLPAEPKPEEKAKAKPTLRATSSAVHALRYLGGAVPDKAACVKFVASCFHPDSGGFADTPGGKPDVFSTSVGVMAVVELRMPAEKYREGAKKFLRENVKDFEDIRSAVAALEALKEHPILSWQWLGMVDEQKNRDGTYGKGTGVARATAGAVVTWLRMTKDFKPGAEVVQTLKRGQCDNGGYCKEGADTSDLETTYRVMRAFVMLKERPPDVEGVRSFVAKCRNEDGGFSPSPGEQSTVAATYHAAILNHWLAQK